MDSCTLTGLILSVAQDTYQVRALDNCLSAQVAIFIYGLFNGAFDSSDYIASNFRMIGG
jgi:hypothetical protein